MSPRIAIRKLIHLCRSNVLIVMFFIVYYCFAARPFYPTILTFYIFHIKSILIKRGTCYTYLVQLISRMILRMTLRRWREPGYSHSSLILKITLCHCPFHRFGLIGNITSFRKVIHCFSFFFSCNKNE